MVSNAVREFDIQQLAEIASMARERILSGAEQPGDEVQPDQFSPALRPKKLGDYVGQRELVEKLRISIQAAKLRNEAMEHVLLHGPPGLGKTTLAHIVAEELNGGTPHVTSGPALAKPTDLMGVLTGLKQGDILFIDEIHRMPHIVEEYLYPAMEDFKIDMVLDSGPHGRIMSIPIQPFTLIGATTRAGLITGPMRARFGIAHHLNYYDIPDLLSIVSRSAGLLNLPADEDALAEVARRARGTPRVANRLLKRVRDFAVVRAKGKLTLPVLEESLKLEGVDPLGLDELDRRFLKVLAKDYEGGPAGIEALAATMGEERDTLEDVVEPFLLQIGFVRRTPRGRQMTPAAYRHMGVAQPKRAVEELF